MADLRFSDLTAALGLLTRLPVPVDGTAAAARGARAAWAWPLAGLAVAGIAGAVGWAALVAGLPAGVAAGLVLAAQVMATGALHEDGLADTADGLWGGWDKERRLEIMRDSRIGAYGVVALVLSLGLRWSALAVVMAGPGWIWALLAAGVASRAGMVVLMAGLPPARPGGLSAATGQPPGSAVWRAAALGAVACVPLLGAGGMWALAAAAGALAGLAAVARAKIGGQTGDILGAGQQLAEIAVLLAVSAQRT